MAWVLISVVVGFLLPFAAALFFREKDEGPQSGKTGAWWIDDEPL